MKKKLRPEYTNLTLGGYQTFAEQTSLPLRQLTFLFGPNSAGKSAVEDGFKLFSELINPGEFEAITGLGGFSILKDHFRRISDEPLKYSDYLTIGLSANISNEVYRIQAISKEFDGASVSNYLSRKRTHTIEYRARFPLQEHTEEGFPTDRYIGHEIEFHFNGSPIIKVHMQKEIGLNLAHPFLKALNIMQDCQSPRKDQSHLARKDKGWLWIVAPFQLEREGRLGYLRIDNEDLMKEIEKVLAAYPDFKPTAEKLLRLMPGLFEIKFSLVHASRTIPGVSDLLFFSDAPEGESNFDNQMRKYPLPSFGDERYLALAKSLVASETTSLSSLNYYTVDRDTSELGDFVNKALSEHLFLERGYRVAAEYRLLLSADQYDSMEYLGNERTRGDYPLIMRLFLVDSQGREFSFGDVGSGLGYVLPVLVSLYGPMKVSLIQQPELHLHPALQAAMGDVLIDACNQGTQVIVETHSEHVLLRVLKRIRQTTAGTLPDDELRISPDDLSILYFDPSPDGTTKVRQIRVTTDGEFLDRWPRGFFAERDLELFDE